MFSPFIRVNGAHARPDLRRAWNDALLEVPFGTFVPGLTGSGAPITGFRDTGDAFLVSLEVPGFTESDLKVEVDRGVVTVTGGRTAVVPEGYRAQVREREERSFTHRYPLPGPARPDEISATLRDGVLTVAVPKAPERAPVTIPVTTH